MREYDFWRQYPYSMDRGYGLVVCEMPPYEWIQDNLLKTDVYIEDDFGEMEYRGKLVKYRQVRVDDDRFLVSFEDKRNRQILMDNYPQFILETDPFGPDLCPKCKGQLKVSSYWKRLGLALLNKG